MRVTNDIQLINTDCIEYMQKNMADGQIDLTLTDIPYGVVNRPDGGYRNLNKGNADVVTFELKEFLKQVYRVTKGTIIIFCAKEQLSKIYGWFDKKQKEGKGTVRQLIWQKTNPSPMNGRYVYLSGIENAVWFRKSGGFFAGYYKNTVFTYPCGRSKIHPTEKNHKLLRELILDNSNIGDVVFDPCMGSGSHLLVAKIEKRSVIGCELSREWYLVAKNRLEKGDTSNGGIE